MWSYTAWYIPVTYSIYHEDNISEVILLVYVNTIRKLFTTDKSYNFITLINWRSPSKFLSGISMVKYSTNLLPIAVHSNQLQVYLLRTWMVLRQGTGREDWQIFLPCFLSSYLWYVHTNSSTYTSNCNIMHVKFLWPYM